MHPRVALILLHSFVTIGVFVCCLLHCHYILHLAGWLFLQTLLSLIFLNLTKTESLILWWIQIFSWVSVSLWLEASRCFTLTSFLLERHHSVKYGNSVSIRFTLLLSVFVSVLSMTSTVLCFLWDHWFLILVTMLVHFFVSAKHLSNMELQTWMWWTYVELN